MEISKKGNTITIKKKLNSDETYRINKSSKMETISFFKKPLVLVGVASSTEDNKEVLFIDYDTDEWSVIENDYKTLQILFKISPGYAFKTNRGFHIVCVNKFTPNEVYNILKHTHCDSAYTDMPSRNKFKNWILRIGPKRGKKLKFVGLIGENKNLNNLSSNAHKVFLSKAYPNIKHPKYTNLDGLKKVRFQTYEASS